MNVQILVLPSGRLVWASDPYPGSMHDVAALDASGLLEGIDPSGWIADKGYVGRGMITPHKKPPNGELSEAAEEANKSINRIRRTERAHHRPHQVLENPPHRLPPPPAHIRTDRHRRTLTLRLQNHPLNKLHSMRIASAIRLINLCGAFSLWARRTRRSSSVNTIAAMKGLYTGPPFRTRTRKHPDERPSDNRTRNQGGVTLLIIGHSIRVNAQWRICFVWRQGGAEDVELVDYH